jgi:hypothetical protein
MTRLPVNLFPVPASAGGAASLVLAVAIGLALFHASTKPSAPRGATKRQPPAPSRPPGSP